MWQELIVGRRSALFSLVPAVRSIYDYQDLLIFRSPKKWDGYFQYVVNMLIRLLLVCLSLELSLLIVEAGFRYFQLAPHVQVLTESDTKAPYIPSSNPVLGYELKPNYRDSNPTNHFGRFSFVNSDGQRDVERSVERIAHRKRIVLLGDSVVAGHGESNFENTISRKLERSFGDGTEILNFGVGGYSTLAEVELLREKGLKYKPDAILLVVVFNDAEESNGDMFRVYSQTRPRLIKELFLRSSFFRFLALQLNLFHFRECSVGWSAKSVSNANGLKNMEKGFVRLAEFSKAHNIPVGVVLWPAFTSSEITYAGSPMKGELPLGEVLAGEHHLPVLRMREPFMLDFKRRCQSGAAAPCPHPQDLYTATSDGIHPNELASELTATAVSSFAKELLKR